MEPKFGELYRDREHEVPNEEKQRLFLLASDILVAGDVTMHWARENEKVLIDSNKLPAKYWELDMSVESDEKWFALSKIGISRAGLLYWPERSYEGRTWSDQINLTIHKSDQDLFDLYTMKLQTGTDSYRVSIGNRVEMQGMNANWLEISRQDAQRIDNVLSTIQTILNPGLATP